MITNEPEKIKSTGTYFAPYEFWFKFNKAEDITESWLKEQRILVEECEVKNKEIEAALLKRVSFIRSEIKDIYGKESKIFKYANSALTNQFSYKPRLLDSIKREEEKFEKRQKELIAIQKKEELEKDALTLTQEAIIFLEKNGKHLGVDYSIETAVREANSLAFDILVAENIKENKEKGILNSFGGEDNCKNCGGWDGFSRRCECGNRRVSWEHDGDFRNMYIYGQAW
jgi:hypothetical protein